MTICFILRLIFLLRERRKLWVYCITAMHANCITALTKWVFYFPFSYLQQFNRVILGLGWDDVRKTKRGGQRGYEGLSIKRAPRRQPGFEFGGRQMLERIANSTASLSHRGNYVFFLAYKYKAPYTLIQTCLIEIMIIVLPRPEAVLN